jgi:hypothetical protein
MKGAGQPPQAAENGYPIRERVEQTPRRALARRDGPVPCPATVASAFTPVPVAVTARL